MSLLLDAPLGVLRPQILLEPLDVVSLAAAEEAIELADAYGIADGHPLDESQRFTLRVGLGERADGSWAASTVCDFEPRQNGKNDSCAARELAGLILFGERLIIHTAHEFPTANESFLRLVAVFENWDDLRKRVARIRYANGEQGIELLSGQRLKYRARTGGSGRGFAKADLVVYDEAQHLQAEHVAASGPTRLANPNSQAWYMGSGGLATSANAWRLRRRALAGERGRFAYVEHTAERVRLDAGRVVGDRPDVRDRAAWADANPAYGRRITEEALQGLFDELGPELFGRECMCLWDAEPGTEGGAIPAGKWAACADPGSAIAGRPFLAVAMTPDRAAVTLAAVGRRPDGLLHVEVVEHGPPGDWFVRRVAEVAARQGSAVAVVSTHPAGALIAAFEAAHVELRTLSGVEYTQAVGAFYDAVVDGTVRYRPPQPELTDAVGRATRKPTGDAWRWAGDGISALVAVTQAAALARQPSDEGWMVVL